MTTRTLVVASGNQGKVDEFKALLAGLPLHVCAIGEIVSTPVNVIEDGRTFADNAIKKAKAAANASGMLTLADDSGLEVDALDGRPGIRSARFAGEHASATQNNDALLAALARLGESGKSTVYRARFRCVLAVVDPRSGRGEASIAEGTCEGTLTLTPRGAGGFGYDPLFVVAGLDKTMAELTRDEKNRLSHRARALGVLRPLLAAICDQT
ncbi:MAG: RdgB/HAM1 family non-canonical purine NTP pyrophosphatase [Myxococcota bacterium]|nr:RdgB/HAM1 family non-canonical purine NTP pyrophosphatase [Myxococcota bacterium]